MFCTPTQTGKLLGFVAQTMAELGMVCAPGTHNQAEHDRILEERLNYGKKVIRVYEVKEDHSMPFPGPPNLNRIRAEHIREVNGIREVVDQNHGRVLREEVSDENNIRTTKIRVEYTVQSHEANFNEQKCCKNPESTGDTLYKSNLDHIYQNNRDKYAPYKKLNRIKGYSQDGNQYDEMIQFWLAYFQDQGFNAEGVDPLLIKALIAQESSFNPKAREHPKTKATGLMQLTDLTRKYLAGELNNDGWQEVREVKIDIDPQCNLEECDAKSPNANIAAGIRWLLYKINDISPCRFAPEDYRTGSKQEEWCVGETHRDKQIRGGIISYYGWDPAVGGGEHYANGIYGKYQESLGTAGDQ